MQGSGLGRAGALMGAIAVAFAGCGGGDGHKSPVARSATSAAKKGETATGAIKEQTKTSAGSSERTVRIKVVHGSGGSVLAAVPVFIEGRGPFAFILDTGASQSAIDRKLARKLRLPKTGAKGQIQGVGGSAQAEEVVIKDWKADKVPLRPLAGVSLGMAAGDSRAGVGGLLGSDVLSGFDSVAIDYQKQTVTLRPKRAK
jgi:predicted aspartyl protease